MKLNKPAAVVFRGSVRQTYFKLNSHDFVVCFWSYLPAYLYLPFYNSTFERNFTAIALSENQSRFNLPVDIYVATSISSGRLGDAC